MAVREEDQQPPAAGAESRRGNHFSILGFISDSPEQASPRLSLQQWVLLWPVFGVRLPEYPPLSTVSGTELTEVFTHPGRWIPPVRASGMPEAS